MTASQIASTERTISGHLLSRNPIIIYGRGIHDDVLGPASALCRYLGERRAYFLISNSWTWEDDERIDRLAAAYSLYMEQYPNHRLTVLCNTQSEVDKVRGLNISARLANHNMFVNEQEFTLVSGGVKKFDAVYNSRINPFKRLELCQDIGSLRLIYYFMGEADERYYNEVKTLLPRADFVNGPPWDYRWFGSNEVAGLLNECRVGLCLSSAEGAMKASMEYLLCGVPVVTTPSLGGRDRYLDEEISITADADPSCIADAVAEIIDRNLDPSYVREKALARAKADREVFLDYLQGIIDQENGRWSIREFWDRIYISNLLRWRIPVDQFIRDTKLLK